MDSAAGGETIKVATGVYTDVHGRPSPAGYNGPSVITQVVYISKTVIVRGGYTTTFTDPPDPIAHPTTLIAQGQGRVLFITGDISPTIEGLCITGGNGTGLGGYDPGFSLDVGGGVYIISSTAIISNSQVFSNTGTYGGGLSLRNSNITLSGNTVIANTASGEYGSGSLSSGGGVYLRDSTATLNGNTVISNTASGNDSHGGGSYLWGGNVTLSSNTVVSNAAQNGGGCTLATAVRPCSSAMQSPIT